MGCWRHPCPPSSGMVARRAFWFKLMRVKWWLLASLLWMACSPKKEKGVVAREKAERLERYRKEMRLLRGKISKLEEDLYATGTLSEKKILVSTRSPERRFFFHEIALRGSVQSDHVVEVSAESSGKITRVLVQAGDKVERHQLLVQLNDEVLQNSLRELAVSLSHAQALYQRQENLWAEKIGTEYQYLEAKNRVLSLEQRIVTLRSQQKQRQVRAAFSGEIDEVFCKIGAFVAPGTPLLRLVSFKNFHVYADVSDTHTGKIQVGNEAQVELLSTQQVVDSQVSFVSHVLDINNRSFPIRIDLPPETRAKVNQVAVVRIRNYTNPEAIVVPAHLVLEDEAGHYLYQVLNADGGKTASKRRITPGKRHKGAVEVLAGLTEDVLLIDKGYRSVFDKASITVAGEAHDTLSQ